MQTGGFGFGLVTSVEPHQNQMDVKLEFDTTESVINEAEPTVRQIMPDIVPDDSTRFILIPLAVLLGILILSALVFLMARNRRRLVAHIYCKHKVNRNFGNYDDDSDSQSLSNDFDDDFDDPTECLLKGKLQIDNQRYDTYQTTQVIQQSGHRELLA